MTNEPTLLCGLQSQLEDKPNGYGDIHNFYLRDRDK